MAKDISKQILKSLGISPFNSNGFVKMHLATSYISDARDFLRRLRLTKNTDIQNRLSSRAKYFVDILMCAECSLKGLIICLSNNEETPEEVYNIVRKKSHDVIKLYNEAKSRAKNRIKLLSKNDEKEFNEVSKIYVNTRYSIDLFYLKSNETLSEHYGQTGKISSTIGSGWLFVFERIAVILLGISAYAESKYLDKYRGMVGINIEKANERMEQFAIFAKLKK